MLNKLLNWIDYHKGRMVAQRLVRDGWKPRDVRTVIALSDKTQAFRDGALDALGGREMAR